LCKRSIASKFNIFKIYKGDIIQKKVKWCISGHIPNIVYKYSILSEKTFYVLFYPGIGNLARNLTKKINLIVNAILKLDMFKYKYFKICLLKYMEWKFFLKN